MLVAKDCRKLVRLAAPPPVPPRSATKASKVVCRELSAEAVALLVEVLPVVLLLVVEPVEPLLSDEIRFCTSAASPEPPAAPCAAPQPVAESDDVASELLPSD